jgi:roadblock/LC7 domain-containing protein
MREIVFSNGSKDLSKNLDDLLQRWADKYSHENGFTVKEVRDMGAEKFTQYIKRTESEELRDLANNLRIVCANAKAALQSSAYTKLQNSKWSKSCKMVQTISGAYAAAIMNELGIRGRKSGESVHSLMVTIMIEQGIITKEIASKIAKEARERMKA